MPTLNLAGERLAITVNDDDFRLVTFYVPADPTADEWAFLVRPHHDTDPLTEWTVTPSDTEVERDAGTRYPVVVDVDTADFGEGSFVWALFRDTGSGLLPYITGTLTTLAVTQPEEGS